MKKSIWMLFCVLGLSSFGHAEDFTMIRGYDGKTFYCTDQQGGVPAGGTNLTICDCSYGSNNYGQVLALTTNMAALRPACQSYYSGANLQNCHGMTASQGGVACDCVYGSNNYGQVLAGVSQLDELAKSCHQSYSGATLKNCKAQ